MSFLNLNDITVSYDNNNNILERLNLDIEEGKLISLLGPSGCGKTTTLRVIAGYIDIKSGSFILDGADMTRVPVHKRNFGIVFQSYALFPHMTVAENVAFGLKMQKMPKEDIMKNVNAMLAVCDLEPFAKRYPKQLSGGQRQRVAIARALVIRPKLLLLDEPLSNLDAKLRLNMRVEIKKIQKQMGITTIFVTHDQSECFAISDKVAVMNHGIIEQYDAPEVIYSKPKTEFVARFVGFENFIALKRQEAGRYLCKNGAVLRVAEVREDQDSMAAECMGTIRPDNIILTEKNGGGNLIAGTVVERTFLGQNYQYEIDTEVGTLIANDGSKSLYQAGHKIWLNLPEDKIVLLS